MKQRFPIILAILLLILAGGALRAAWLTADPPATGTVGIVWHDEGAWVHNARNRVLWGTWRTDAWNPMYVTPVFTGLEYVAFEAFGVGTWQARTVSVAAGLVAVAALAWGLLACAGRRAAVVGAALLATNFFFVIWNRAALAESTMTTCLVVAWAAWARAHRRPAWGLAAGAATVLAFFTKASAAFFVGAMGLEAGTLIAFGLWPGVARAVGARIPERPALAAARWTLAGLALAALVAAAVFVVPHWAEFRFYNWQMSVTRKPEYSIAALANRASWLPVVHDVFSRVWIVLAAASVALLAVVARWWRAPSAMRLLALWVLIGFAELIVHDSGNERRYVMFIPALVALAASLASFRPWAVPAGEADEGRAGRLAALPVVLLLGYLVWGALVRLPDLDRIYAHDLQRTVRIAAALAVITALVVWWRWRPVLALVLGVPSRRVVVALAALAVLLDLGQFGVWAARRTDLNYRASLEVGRLLPAGTLVQGKLANGLALENRIRPVFVGRGFGNYDDRLSRDDVRYVLTYVQPWVGYESGTDGALIQEILDRYPDRRIVATFPVDETPGPDEAALIDKFPAAPNRPGSSERPNR